MREIVGDDWDFCCIGGCETIIESENIKYKDYMMCAEHRPHVVNEYEKNKYIQCSYGRCATVLVLGEEDLPGNGAVLCSRHREVVR